MEDLGRIHQLIIHILGKDFTFNVECMIMTWIVIISLIFFGYMAARKRNIIPNLVQVVGELIIRVFYDLTEDALGKELSKKYAPMICGLFMFLFLCNWLGIFPHLEEPTKDLNTPLSYGIMGFVLAHHAGIKAKGLKTYLKDYCEPAKVISISFRLFGNIMGGSIIILVVSYLTFNLVTPPFLNAFFGAFVGTIQAFVFTMLTLVYIAVQVA